MYACILYLLRYMLLVCSHHDACFMREWWFSGSKTSSNWYNARNILHSSFNYKLLWWYKYNKISQITVDNSFYKHAGKMNFRYKMFETTILNNDPTRRHTCAWVPRSAITWRKLTEKWLWCIVSPVAALSIGNSLLPPAIKIHKTWNNHNHPHACMQSLYLCRLAS